MNKYTKEDDVRRMGDERKRVILIGILLSIIFAGLYISFPPSLLFQHFDSLSYAYLSEKLGIRMMMGNHPLGHFILNVTYELANSLGYSGRGLPWFQIANGALSGIGIGIFFVLGVTIYKFSKLTALGIAVILGSIYSYWYYAGTARYL